MPLKSVNQQNKEIYDRKIRNQKMRIIFMGTPEFAAPGLRALLAAPDFEIVAVFTQPDKAVGRRQIITPPPIKTLALKQGLKVFQPERIKNEIETIKNLQPDLIVVIAYGQIIPPMILDLPVHGCLNVHASLLPKYRGAAVLNAPILNGDAATGVTIMKMEAGLDTGPILRQAKIQLNGRETLEEVHDRLAQLGAELLAPTIIDFTAGKIKPQAQDEALATYVKILKKEDGKIDWTKSAETIERMVRAYNPWPGTYALLNNGSVAHAGLKTSKLLKILEVEHEIFKTNAHKIGELFLHEQKLAVQCGQDALIILKLQIEGKKILNAKEFLAGQVNLVGAILK